MKQKTQVDLLHGPIMKSLIIFMIPIVISNIFQQFYNAVDTAIVGNYLGETSLAAIGSCAAVFEMLVSFCNSLGNGFSIVCGRSFGSGDEDTMKRSVAGSIMIGAVTCVVLTLLCFVGLKPLLRLINTPEAILNEAHSYIIVIGAGRVVTFSYNLCSCMLRAIGNSVMPLIFLIVSSLLNIVLDILLITTFHMGVVGAAVATVIAQGISVALCIYYILNYVPVLIPEKKHFRIASELLKDIAGQGYAMALMGSIVSVGSILLQSGINSLGTQIIAGHVAARKLYMVSPWVSQSVHLLPRTRAQTRENVFSVLCVTRLSMTLYLPASFLRSCSCSHRSSSKCSADQRIRSSFRTVPRCCISSARSTLCSVY